MAATASNIIHARRGFNNINHASLRVLQRDVYTRIISDSFSVLALLTLRLRQTFLSYSETAAGNGTSVPWYHRFHSHGHGGCGWVSVRARVRANGKALFRLACQPCVLTCYKNRRTSF